MTTKEKRILAEKAEWEGIDEIFTNYSGWDEIKDKEFHKLRKKFLDAREKLLNYSGLNNKQNDGYDNPFIEKMDIDEY